MVGSAGLIRLSTALATVLILGALAGASAFLIHDRHESWQHAAATSRNMAAILQSDIGRTIRIYDMALMGVVEALGYQAMRQMPAEAARQLMFDRAAMTDYLGAMVVLDENGSIRFDSRSDPPRQGNFADRDYFRVHQGHSDVGLYISKPLNNRLHNDEPGIALSRRLSHPDGSFAGIAVAILRTAYLNQRFAQLALEPHETITLFREDGIVMWQWPDGWKYVGMDVAGRRVHQEFQRSEEGTFLAPSDDADTTLFYTYAHVPGLPLVITIAQPAQAITAPWRLRAWFITLSTLLLCATVAGLGYSIRRTIHAGDLQLARWEKLAQTDGLTGLLNRRAFDVLMREAWRTAAIERMPLSLLFIDADHFKRFNDIHGHQAGDDFLRHLASIIRASTRRPRDASARYGGEEFVLLLRDTAGPDAVRIAEKMRTDVEALRISNGLELATVSIGVASLTPALGDAPDAIVAKADAALYEAKAGGRNKVHLARD